MLLLERKPKKVPLPCYGLEHNALDPVCQQCPYVKGCRTRSGARLDKVPLSDVKFNLVGKHSDATKLEAFDRTYDADDPELPYLQRLYADCFETVFSIAAIGNVSQIKDQIAENARLASCSIRMYMLANMVAHTVHEKIQRDVKQTNRSARFTAGLLVSKLAVKRAQMYQEMCREKFGTFSLSSLSVLSASDLHDDLEANMLRSEVTAARWYIRYKIFNSSDGAERALYESEELQLAVEWLAIEDTYDATIVQPYLKKELPKTSQDTDLHRFNVVRTKGHLKKCMAAQRAAFIARQRIMSKAVDIVVRAFNHQPDDFLYPRGAVTQPMQFWKQLALTIRHYHCWLYINGQPSYFTPKRHAEQFVRPVTAA